MRIDEHIVKQQITALKLAYPDIADDEDDWSLSLETETEFDALLERVVCVMRESASMAGGIAGRIAELEIRQGRYERRELAMRTLAFKLMQHAEVQKRELPEATLSIRKGVPKVIITDDASIPDNLCRIRREPDKSKIREHLTNGEPVMGAELSNAEPSLSVRTK